MNFDPDQICGFKFIFWWTECPCSKASKIFFGGNIFNDVTGSRKRIGTYEMT